MDFPFIDNMTINSPTARLHPGECQALLLPSLSKEDHDTHDSRDVERGHHST